MSATSSSKYVIVTGASSGIGRACAKHLDNHGYTVYAGVRNELDGHSLRSACSNRLIPVMLDVCDVASIESVADLLDASISSTGLAALVNNAGIPLVGPLEFLSLEKFRTQVETNVCGLISVTQHLLPLLRKGNGRIINIGSISGRVALPFLGPYAATKFAVEAISDSLRIELKPWNIPVTVIEPGNTDTAIREKAMLAFRDEIQQLPPAAHMLYGPLFNYTESHKEKRMIGPERVAHLVEHVLNTRTPKSRYLVGNDARMLALIQKLPVRIRDAIITWSLPTYGRDG